ncbi:hypothetical protein J6590_021459 [Homalodisca vitripennis]|nr:hypothetical protein J6590_021459 [Homalodisca vitripennis]
MYKFVCWAGLTEVHVLWSSHLNWERQGYRSELCGKEDGRRWLGGVLESPLTDGTSIKSPGTKQETVVKMQTGGNFMNGVSSQCPLPSSKRT